MDSNNVSARAAPGHARVSERIIDISSRRFDVKTIPVDMQRVYSHLEKDFGEEYGLLFVFVMRTAIELHRAWHMTMLTNTILQQVKEKFNMRMTWNLGVVHLKFRVEDGGYELHRKVPYDYDSEYQDVYYRIAEALIEGEITIHEALLYQTETKQGKHTAASGRFLRDPPGRLIVYPLQAATCAVIFFDGKWIDAAAAAICGLAAGLLEWALTAKPTIHNVSKMLIDLTVGMSTGIIGGLWYEYVSPSCLSAIFMGTLYWFFYGTAFVIGLLEIIAGELETGVTRFVAVSVKTFVLSLGASLGLMLASREAAYDEWYKSQDQYCDGNFVDGKWWRIPLYLLCSVAVLGQYRLPLDKYWLGLAVQLVAYEVQYSVINAIDEFYTRDHLDTAASNISGAAAGVICAAVLSFLVNKCREFYSTHLLRDEPSPSRISNFVFGFMRFVAAWHCLGLGSGSNTLKLGMAEKLRVQRAELSDPRHPRDRIELFREEEDLFLETVVGIQDINVWAILMPAVYQLVPGSVIAKFWFVSIFPPQPGDKNSQDSTFSNLMVISTSLALGLIVGFAIVQICAISYAWLSAKCLPAGEDEHRNSFKVRRADRFMGMYTPGQDEDPIDNPLLPIPNTDKEEEGQNNEGDDNDRVA